MGWKWRREGGWEMMHKLTYMMQYFKGWGAAHMCVTMRVCTLYSVCELLFIYLFFCYVQEISHQAYNGDVSSQYLPCSVCKLFSFFLSFYFLLQLVVVNNLCDVLWGFLLVFAVSQTVCTFLHPYIYKC